MADYSFYFNTKFVCGRGSLGYLNELDSSRTALVIDSRALAADRLEEIKKRLTGSGRVCQVVADVSAEPSTDAVQKVLEHIRAFKPDCILAIGGGSVLDTAKALWVFYEHPDYTWEQAFTPFGVGELGKAAKLVAVPTTSGTGSETTCVAVITDSETGLKRLIMSDEIVPTMAILDADMVSSMPAKVAAYSGLDALSHAIEGAACSVSCDLAVSVALGAALDILEYLPASVKADPESDEGRKAREIMHTAASMAGMAINKSCTGLTHSIDQIGPIFGLPHGLVCGLLLPHTIAYSSPHPIYVRIARRAGYVGSDKEMCDGLVKRLWDLNAELGIPRNLKDLGVDREEFASHVDRLAKIGVSTAASKFSPAPLDEEKAKALLWQAYEG
ncbi:MAG: iron-containing alcohol dehydrogenase [Firmicutes bacterium]|nr:iron-containing alcohol dehydrogenase [Bacillota bacterium]MDD4792129.1 iron-containing alcohol dehydrogenase [Bacillota bacterium]